MAKRSRSAMIHPPRWGMWSLWGMPWFKSKMKKQTMAVGWQLLEAVRWGSLALLPLWPASLPLPQRCPLVSNCLFFISPSQATLRGAQWCQQEAEILPFYQTEIWEKEKVIESNRFGLKLGRLTHLLIQWLFIDIIKLAWPLILREYRLLLTSESFKGQMYIVLNERILYKIWEQEIIS